MEVMPRSPGAGPPTSRASVLPSNPAGSAQCAASGVPPTIGVEEEFILVDSHTGAPQHRNAAVVEDGTALGIDLQLELARCQIETATPVCARISDLVRELCRARSLAAAAAARSGTRLLATGVPVLGPLPRAITDTPRYRRMADGRWVRRTGRAGDLRLPRPCLRSRPGHGGAGQQSPAALAARAVGVDGELADRRQRGHRICQLAPHPVGAVAERGTATVFPVGATLRRRGRGDAGLRQRPRSGDGLLGCAAVRASATIEIRISDVPATVHETVLLAFLVRGLVITALSELGRGDLARPVGDDLLRAACWRAAHDGLTGHGIDTAAQNLIPVARLLGLLLAHVRTALEDYACARAAVARVLAHGNGAVHQRRALRAGTLTDVVRAVADRTVEICSPDDDYWASVPPADVPESPVPTGECPVSPATGSGTRE